MVARHCIATPGRRGHHPRRGHVTALTAAPLAAFTTQAPHRREERRTPTAAARAEADPLRTRTAGLGTSATVGGEDRDVVVDLARYAAVAAGRNTVTTDPSRLSQGSTE